MSGQISDKIRVGMAELYNMKIEGLDQVTFTEPLEFERLLTVPNTYAAAPIRVRLELAFDYLEVEADVKVRYTYSKRQVGPWLWVWVCTALMITKLGIGVGGV
ncbi:unnamed protein product [Echinostoma caproni]|uniref:LEA_2 domain-containing protein n=1 Tax=Echinostoma caproni TaxID=27848 RepID=A0A183AAJ0_9TREM|nr:unnamed protein product [Echinostoma caproni]